MRRQYDSTEPIVKAFDKAMHEVKTQEVVEALHSFIRGDSVLEVWPGNSKEIMFVRFVRVK